MKKQLTVIALAMLATTGWAQSGTNSPYSQYGLGTLSDQSTGFNRGMNGLALGFREHNQVNPANPASYSAIDSLSFIFDAGISLQQTNFKEGGRKLNANNADFEYVVAGFRLFRHFGVSFGLLPYTNIGYSYSTTTSVGDANKTYSYNAYSGDGGLHQVYLGFGWEPIRNFSIGVNGTYLYGDYTRTVTNSYSNTSANSLIKTYSADVRSYKLDAGLQYTLPLSKKDQLTLGLTYGMGHNINGKPQVTIVSSNSVTAVADTTTYPGAGQVNLRLRIPNTFGAGLTFNHNNKFKIGADYTLQQWAKISAPELVTDNSGNISYQQIKGYYKDRHQFTVGTQICPDEYGRSFLKRIRYRAGVSYATPYYYIGNQEGPKELSASLGFGIPIVNGYNNRSLLNISAQWVKRSAKNLITENTFRINIGITFNEQWFAKWKVQ
jgi:hypothetical protein